VHALYNRSRKSGVLLALVFITGFALEVTSDIRVIKSVIDGQHKICTPPPYERVALALFAYVVGSLSTSPSLKDSLILRAGVGLVQSTLLLMTVSKVILGRKLGWARTPLVSLMLRDGVLVFALLVGEHYTTIYFLLSIFTSLVILPSCGITSGHV
jgi:hypothetical protein